MGAFTNAAGIACDPAVPLSHVRRLNALLSESSRREQAMRRVIKDLLTGLASIGMLDVDPDVKRSALRLLADTKAAMAAAEDA
jgi:hypothetical protein